MQFKYTDSMTIADAPRRTADGYLVASVRAARAGMQDYAGYEVGKPDKARVRVYRPAAEVFKRDSLASYAHRPVTDDHPSDMVDATNWKDHSVGSVGDEVTRDGEFVRISLIVMDAPTIDKINEGKRELSAGYLCELDHTAGVTDDGEAYDAIQKDIKINHVAIVSKGRAGSLARIGDAALQTWGSSPLPLETNDKGNDMTVKTVTVDGVPYEVSDQVSALIAGLQTKLADSATSIAALNTSHGAALAVKDARIGELTVELQTAAALIPSQAALEVMARDRSALIDAAKIIHPEIAPAGLTDSAIRRAAVAHKLGDDSTKDVNDDVVAGMFKALSKTTDAADPVRDALRHTSSSPVLDTGRAVVDTAYEAMLKQRREAWKTAV